MVGELSKRGTVVAALLVTTTILCASRGGARPAFYATLMVLFPLACIVFPSTMGRMKGMNYITRESNPIGVSIMGWAVLVAYTTMCLVSALTR